MDSNKFVDRCIIKSGGRFNLFRKIFATLLASLFGIQSLFIFGFGFFETMPALLCPRELDIGQIQYFSCLKEEACGAQNFKIDYNNSQTIKNWITSYDLVCVESYKISLFGSLLFLGLLCGSIFISRLGDVYGRKPILTICIILSSVALLTMLLTNNLYFLFVGIFVFGVSAAPRYTLSYVYASEIVDSSHESTYCMIAMIIDSLAMIVYGVYYQFVKSMYPLLWFLLITQILFMIIAQIFIPESPQYLYEKGDMDRFFSAIESIAKFNREQINITELKSLYEQEQEQLQNQMYQADEVESLDKQSNGSVKQQQRSDERPYENNLTEEQERKGSLKQFFQNKRYFLNTIALCISWGVGSYAFYFTEFYMKYVPIQNEYHLSILIGISDVISASSFKFLILVATLKRIIGFSYLALTGISLAFSICLYLQLETTDNVRLIYAVFVFGIRFTSGVGFMMSYFANNHYFPPLFRAGIFAITNVASRMSTILSPIVAEALANPSITIAIAGALATAATALLKNEQINSNKENVKPNK